MSLILEALKKSEAERRLGRAPDLLAPAPLHPASRHMDWRGVGIGALVTLALALGVVAGWRWWFGTTPTQPVGVVAPDAPAAAVALSLPASPPASTAAVTEARAPTPLRAEAEVIANVPVPEDAEFIGTERESMPVPAGAVPLAQPRPRVPERPMRSVETAPVPHPDTPPPARNEDSAKPPPATAAAPLEALPHLAGMTTAEREGLPPLRLSMHVYDPDPPARFVLIDGKRYRQGDALAPGLVLDEIRPDGVAIAWHGRRFLVSRP